MGRKITSGLGPRTTTGAWEPAGVQVTTPLTGLLDDQAPIANGHGADTSYEAGIVSACVGSAAAGRLAEVELAARTALTVTVVVPSRNEAGNVAELTRRLDAALGVTPSEVIFVDDSDDDTPQCIRDLAAGSRRPLRVLHRAPGQRAGGLGSAVVTGLKAAQGEWVVVMDADLQHPPETVPLLLAPAAAGAVVDVVVASRYRDGGDAGGLASPLRKAVSTAATLVTQRLVGGAVARCSDPMSGFFALRRMAVDPDRLHPNGFKILLEILTRNPGLRLDECPFSFAVRHAGDSKASAGEGARFASHLLALVRSGGMAPRAAALTRMTAFGIFGASGIGVNSLVLWLTADGLGLYYLAASVVATQIAMVWNFAWLDWLVFAHRKQQRRLGRFLYFAAASIALLGVQLGLLSLLVEVAGLGYLLANVLVLVPIFLTQYLLSDKIIFRPVRQTAGHRSARRRRVFLVGVIGEAVTRPNRGNPPLRHLVSQTRPDDDH